jgi:DNA-binding PadR family transcriptional regulator
MSSALELLEAKEKSRYEVLKQFYEYTNGRTCLQLDLSEHFREKIRSPEETMEAHNLRDVIDYLSEEGLIDDTGGGEEFKYSITHKGVIEMENSIRNPEKSTDHFSSPVIQIFNAPVGNIQAGNNNTSYVNQVNDISSTEVQNAIQDLKSLVGTLLENHQNDASEVIEDLQEEIANPTKQSRLKSSLITLWQYGKEVASFANSVSAVAQRFGIDLSSF